MATFRELMSQPTETFTRPAPLPKGHYKGTIKGHEIGESKQKKTAYVRFLFTPTEAQDDVENSGTVNMSDRELRQDFFVTPKALYRLSQFLDNVLGKQEGKSFDERLPDTNNVEVIIGVEVVDANNESGDQYNNVTTVVKT